MGPINVTPFHFFPGPPLSLSPPKNIGRRGEGAGQSGNRGDARRGNEAADSGPRGDGGGSAMGRRRAASVGVAETSDGGRLVDSGGPSGDGARRSSGEGAECSGSGATRSSLGSPDGSSSLQLAGAKSLSPLLADACCSAQRRRAAALLSWLLPHTGVDESLAIP